MDTFSSFHSRMISKTRTAGDGMESTVTSSESNISPKTDLSNIPTNNMPHNPNNLVQLYPSTIIKLEKKKNSMQSKSLKFVPYEPYAGAVKPMTPQFMKKEIKKSRNNMDINTLISQMSQMNTNLSEFKPRPKLTCHDDKATTDDQQCTENIELQNKVQEVMKENEILKEQLKQQVQVNKELKTMLVASMGEDLETQVHTLNEDKKHLANALLNSAQHLSTHQEQTEWLAGQCEVWRSKFLASSLMVEELANSKKLLLEKTEVMQRAIKQLLDERYRARDMMICTYRNLLSLHEKWLEDISITEYVGNNTAYSRPIGNFNFTASQPHSTNVLDLSSVNLKLSENISSSIKKQELGLDALPSVTEGEINAENAMAMPIDGRKVNDEPVSALVHHAYSNSGNTVKPMASCVHCNGKVQLL